ncbi:MAG: FmdB family zinc ribbon protein [Marmoricola sp.]
MPTYQYSCTDCGHFFEVFQSFSDDSLTQCPECAGRLRKVFNAVGVVFKGSGFYRNDSRSTSSSSSTSDSGATSTSSDKGSEKKSSDTAPVKTPTKPAEKASSSSSSTASTSSSS